MALYDRIGTDYDVTRRADPYITERLIHHLNPQPDGRYLDLGCGTGNYAIAIASVLRVEVHGIDQSRRMICTAREKRSSVAWHCGDAEFLPFRENSFSGVMCILGMHHFKHLGAVFEEVFRILEGGRFVIFTATQEQMRGYWLNRYFPNAMEKSIRQMLGLRSLIEQLRNAGFRHVESEAYRVTNSLQDLFLYSGKHRPEIYLDPRIRRGISTFANLADPGEVERGCVELASDIRSGRIEKVIHEARDREGDYLFVAAGTV